MTKPEQIDAMTKEVSASIEIKCVAKCYFCGDCAVWSSNDFCGESTERKAANDAAVWFFELGWRIVTSRKYQVTGAVRCPNCKGEI